MPRGGGNQSITHFHHQLRVLEHSAPEPIVAPAYRLRAVDDTGSPTSITYPDSTTPPVLTVVGAKELPRPALAFLGEPAPVAADTGRPAALPAVARLDDLRGARPPVARRDAVVPSSPPVEPAPTPRGAEALTRQRARQRRRDTLTVLAAAFVVTLVLAVVLGSAVTWAACALVGVALVAYVASLVHLRREARERELKLHYLDAHEGRPSPTAARTPYVSGRYAHPSNQQYAAR